MYRVLNDSLTLQARFNNAITSVPIRRKINELTLILRECNIKELEAVVLALIENIFGVKSNYSQNSGWQLHNTIRYNDDFEATFTFLHPQGVLFESIYRLLGDLYLKYEFSLTYLPQKFTQMILDGKIPQFYIDKIQFDSYTRTPSALALNAFEFYMFHFAYNLINPWSIYNLRPAGVGHETVYLHLSDVYLSHFLPVDTSVVLPVVALHQATQLPRSPPPQTNPARIPKLFKPSVLLKFGSQTLSPPSVSQPHTEVWRSETLIQVIICLWLSFNEEDINMSTNTSLHENLSLPYSRYPQTYNYRLGYWFRPKLQLTRGNADFLPTEDHLRVLRNTVKHIHYFCNNLQNDNSAMDELKRVVCNCFQNPLYTFLRRQIHHWPLDSSFILILETYLSYIQPWRYVNYNNVKGTTHEQLGESNPVDGKWINYISENYLTYNVMFGELIQRFTRLDLTSPRHAQMLYRVCKVLSQPNLTPILQEIEITLNTNLMNDTSYTRQNDYSQPNVLLTHKLNALVKQQITELEQPKFQYIPLFGEEMVVSVSTLIRNTQQANIIVKTMLESSLAERSDCATFTQMLKDFFIGSQVTDDYTVDEKQRTVTYLEQSISLLCDVFNLKRPDQPEIGLFVNNLTQSDDGNSSNNSSTNTIDPNRLNPREFQKRAKLLKYSGNPDLHPIMSNECTVLVRLLHRLSSRINELYGHQLTELWHRQDIWGKICRQLLTGPCQSYYFDKKSQRTNYAPRVTYTLPPRVCLRHLASYKIIFNILLLGILFFIFNYPLFPSYIVVFMLYAVIIFIKAILEPFVQTQTAGQHSSVRPHQMSFSFDGSFNE